MHIFGIFWEDFAAGLWRSSYEDGDKIEVVCDGKSGTRFWVNGEISSGLIWDDYVKERFLAMSLVSVCDVKVTPFCGIWRFSFVKGAEFVNMA